MVESEENEKFICEFKGQVLTATLQICAHLKLALLNLNIWNW